MTDSRLSLKALVGGGYNRFWNFKGRYRLVKGSRMSKKSKTCALWYIIHLCTMPLANLLVVRRYQSTLRDSCYADLRWAISRLGLDGEFKFTTAPMEITRIRTGQKILFRGLDDAQKVTSISVAHGVLCWTWIEEAYQLESEEEFNRLDLSIRGEMPAGYYKQLTLIFNPWSETTWLKPRFFDPPNTPDKLALTTTYQCNEWLDESDRRIFEEMKIRQPRRYAIEGLAEWGRSEDLIFTDLAVREFDWRDALKLPDSRAIFGLDFGFTDPTAFIAAVLCKKDKAIFIFAEWYQPGATNRAIAKGIKQLGIVHEMVLCDAAEPKSIAELYALGINAKAAPKGADSVRYGIQLLQNYKIIIHPSCANAVHEFQNYAWAKDRAGKPTDRPDHEFSHCPDALRYAASYYIDKRKMEFKI